MPVEADSVRGAFTAATLQQYVVHYHEERNHQGKENLILFPLETEGARNRRAAVRCHERLGGLLKYYEREAA
jgi:putative transposase